MTNKRAEGASESEAKPYQRDLESEAGGWALEQGTECPWGNKEPPLRVTEWEDGAKGSVERGIRLKYKLIPSVKLQNINLISRLALAARKLKAPFHIQQQWTCSA